MAFKLKTSKRASEIFDQIESSENLPCYTLVKLAMALSLRSKKPHEDSDFRTNTLGRELNRQTITGDVDAVYKTIFYKGIMPSEKVLDFPVDCNTLTGSVNL